MTNTLPPSAEKLGSILSIADLYRLSLSSLRALCAVAANPEHSLPMTRVAEALDVSSTAVTAIADNLERMGLVERKLTPNDRRQVLMTLTTRGMDCVSSILAA